jgi:hypothetical protein
MHWMHVAQSEGPGAAPASLVPPSAAAAFLTGGETMAMQITNATATTENSLFIVPPEL